MPLAVALTDVARYRDALTGQLAVSIGISEMSATDAESGGILAAADAALYEAKAAGGGHAVIAQPEVGRRAGNNLTLTEARLPIENRTHIGACGAQNRSVPIGC